MKASDPVWYVAYGSNMNERRFSYYVTGGIYPPTGVPHEGCSDRRPIQAKASAEVDHEVFFAEKSKGWQNGGIAFLSQEKVGAERKALVSLYKITLEQFFHIFLQENGTSFKESHEMFDINKLLDEGHLDYGDPDSFKFYGHLMCLGHRDGDPMLTFTRKTPLGNGELNPPSKEYLKTIHIGLANFHGLTEEQATNYFRRLKGVSGKIDKERLEGHLNRLTVEPTVTRNGAHGWFMVCLNKLEMDKRGLRPNAIVVLSNVLGGAEPSILSGGDGPEVTREDGPHQRMVIHAKLGLDPDALNGTIRVDQKLRMALGLTTLGSTLDLNAKSAHVHRWYGGWLANFFGIQRNIARVKFADFSDMEVSICRVSRGLMATIGIKPGDNIVLEAFNSKQRQFVQVELRALAFTEERMRLFDHDDHGIPPMHKDKYAGVIRSLKERSGMDGDIPFVAIDLATRERLGLEPEAPVYVHRSVRKEIGRRIHKISSPIILACLGALMAFKGLHDDPLLGLLVLGLGLLIVFALHLWSLRQRVE